jgi:hypothetical protein
MTRVLPVVLLALALAGCAGTDAAPRAAATGAATPGASASADPVDVYAAAIIGYLSGKENSFPGTTFPVAFVLDRLDPAAADPMTRVGTGPTTPLTAAQRQRIAAVVGTGTKVEFVTGLDAVTADTGDDVCAVVKDDGVFLALGPATPTGADTAQVAVHGFVACEGATWFTYVLRRDAAGWTVTGTTGSVSVS